MNVERLHRILTEFEADLKKSNLIAQLQAVKQHLQNQVNQPNQPSHQTNMVNSLNEVYKALENSRYNSYTPMFKETIKEVSNNSLFGIELKNRIELIFSSNVITPAKALEDISQLEKELTNFQTGISNTLAGLKILNVSKEELKPGECEFGYSIPREFIENKLVELRDEISELTFILNFVTEAVTGQTEEYKVKTISSSNFLLYIVIGLQVADALSKATERILNHYKQILEIKNLRNQLAENGVPNEATKEIENHANGIMKSEIKKIANEIITEKYIGDIGRKNEVENGLVIALNKLANRLDNGFNVEIRVEPLPKPKDAEANDKYILENNLIQSIQKSANNIDYIEAKGKAILQLPEKNDE